jgi:hypothetical protein
MVERYEEDEGHERITTRMLLTTAASPPLRVFAPAGEREAHDTDCATATGTAAVPGRRTIPYLTRIGRRRVPWSAQTQLTGVQRASA